MLYLIAAGLLVFLISTYILFYLLKKTATVNWVSKLRNVTLPEITRKYTSQEWFAKAQDLSKKRINRPFGLLIISSILGLFGSLFIYFYFYNLLAAILMFILIALIIDQLYFNKQKSKQEKLIIQLGPAVRTFYNEYHATPQTIKALGNMAKSQPEPLRGILQKAERSLRSGQDRHDVLLNLAEQFNISHGKTFVELLRLSFEDKSVEPLFLQLAQKITTEEELIKESKKIATTERFQSIGMNLLIVPVYFGIKSVFPGSYEYYTTTPFGRICIVVCVLSGVLGLTLERLTRRMSDV